MNLFGWLRSLSRPPVRRRPVYRPVVERLEARTLLSFASPLTFGLPAPPNGIAVGDFNHDGITDLVTCSNTGTISVLLGNGNGTFRRATRYEVNGPAYAVATGDFNHDGYSDVAVRTADAVEIFLGGPGGVLRPDGSYPVVAGTYSSLVVGDFNGDHNLDLVVGSASNAISVLLGKGNGTFQQAFNETFSCVVSQLAKGDFNHDGKADLVCSGGQILFGNGNGTFQNPTGPAPFLPGQVVVGDFNHDGVPDVAVLGTSPFAGQPLLVHVYLNNGNGTAFTSATLNPSLTSHAVFGDYLAAGDFNGDGNLDLAVTGVGPTGDDAVALFLNPGNGWASATGVVSASTPEPTVAFAGGVVAADFNGDGVTDLAIANRGDARPPSVNVLLGKVHNQFSPPVAYGVGLAPSAAVVADFNGDGKPDLAVANYHSDTISVLLNAGNGTFLPAVTYATAHGPNDLAVADLNHDGHPDLIVACTGVPGDGLPAGNTVQVFLNNGNGTFQPPVSYTVGAVPSSVAVGDFNGDGIPDLVTANTLDRSFSILLGKGDGTFFPALTYHIATYPVQVIVGDFNGDGKADLAMTQTSNLLLTGTSILTIRLGNGNGTFAPPIGYTLGVGLAHLAKGDFNGDGKTDLVVANAGTPFVPGSTVSVLLGTGHGTFGLAGTYKVGLQPWSVLVGDFNGDGKPDVVTADADGSGVSLALGAGAGTFSSVVPYAAVATPEVLAKGDFNGDGRPDLVVASGRIATVVVLMNDPPVIHFVAASDQVAVSETSPGLTLTVALEGQWWGLVAPVTVDVEVTAGNAVNGLDFTLHTGTVALRPANHYSVTIPLTLIDDTRQEGNRTFDVSLLDPTGGILGDLDVLHFTIGETSA